MPLSPASGFLLTLGLLLSVAPACVLGRSAESEDMTYEYLPSLVRFNRAGELVSSDLSEYVTFTCRDTSGGGRKCSADISEDDFREALDYSASASDEDNIVSYLEGVAMYAAINFAGLILLILFVAIYLIVQLFMCCCKCCDKATPLKSPPMSRFFCAYGCLGVSLLFISCVAILGHTLGGSQLTQGIVSSSDSAAGIQSIVQGTAYPMQQVVVNTFSSVAVPALSALNKTFFEVVDLEGICRDTVVIDGLYNQLGVVSLVRHTLDDLATEKWEVIDDIEVEIDRLVVDIEELESLAMDMRAEIVNADYSIGNITESLEVALPLVESIDEDSVLLLGPSAETGQLGLVGSSLADLSTLRRNESAPGGLGFPYQDTFADAAEGSLPTVDSLLPTGANSLAGNPSGISDLNDKLTYIYDLMVLLPNYTTTALKLIRINDTINDALAPGGVMESLEAQADIILSLQASIPSGEDTKVFAANFIGKLRNLTFTDLRSSIVAIGPFIDDLAAPLIVIHGKLVDLDITVLIPPLYHVMVEVSQRVSERLFDLDGIYNSTEDYLPLEKQVLDNVDGLDEVTDSLMEAIDSFYDVNISDYLKTLDKINAEVDAALDDIDEEELYRLIDRFADSATTVNTTKLTDDLYKLKQDFEDIDIPYDVVTALESLEMLKNAAIADLERAIGAAVTIPSVAGTPPGDLLLLAKGVCSDDSDVYCSVDADCGGTCVSAGVYRCSAAGDGLNAAVTACFQDSDCPGSTYCLNDVSRAAYLKGMLQGFAEDTAIDSANSTSAQISGLDALSFKENFNTTDAIIKLSQTITDLQDINLQTYVDQLDDVTSQVTADDLAAVDDALVEVRQVIEDFDFSSYNATLKDVESIIDDLGEYFPDVVITCYQLRDFIFNQDGLQSHFNFFSESNLANLADTRGPGGMLTAAMGRVDRIGGIFREMFINFTTLDRISSAADAEDFSRTLNKISGNPNSGYGDIYRHGSLYFLTQLYNKSKDATISAHDPIASGVYEGSDGKRYEDNKWCVTKECFIQTKEDLEEDPMVKSLAIDTSFEAIVGYVWIGPFIAVFFGLVTLLCPLCTSKPWARRCPASCMVACAILQLGPFLLLTGLLFPFVIFAADSCDSSSAIGQNYMKAYGDDTCTELGGKGTLRSCTFDSYNFSVTIDPYGMASGVLGECLGDPFTSPMDQLAAQLRSSARSKAHEKSHGEYSKDLEIKRLNVDLENIGLDAAENIAGVFASFLEDIGDEVLSCEKVKNVKSDLIYPVCSSTVGALGWYLGCLYLMAWSLCCLAIPAGCLVEHDNTQRQKEYAAYTKAFGDDHSEAELDEGAFQAEGSDDGPDVHDKRMAVRDDDGEEEDGKGAYGAVFGHPQHNGSSMSGGDYPPSAPIAPDHYDEGDGVELRYVNDEGVQM